MVLTVNSRGDFHLDAIEPGRYVVQIASQYDGGGYYSDLTVFEVVDSDVSDVEIKAIRGLSLSGVVVPDGITSKEVLALLPSLRVYANVPSASSTIRTSSSGSSAIAGDGSFQINGLRPGKASIYVSGGGESRRVRWFARAHQ